jgi:hypothetical protein
MTELRLRHPRHEIFLRDPTRAHHRVTHLASVRPFFHWMQETHPKQIARRECFVRVPI